MDTTTIIAICGIAATCIFGGLAIWLARRRRYPGRITYFEESSIGLFDSIVRNLDDLSVIYRDKPVSENIVLLKGYIINTGSKDVTPAMIEEPVALKLPSDFRWLDAKVVSSSTSVKADLKIKDETSAELDIGLFRVNEYVQFEGLAEVPAAKANTEADRRGNPARTLSKALTITQRVADTQQAKINKLSPHKPLIDFLQEYFFISALALILVGHGVRGLATGPRWDQKLHFFIETQSGDTVEAKIDVGQDGMLGMNGVDNPVEQRQSLTEFFAGCNLVEPRIVEKSYSLPWFYGLRVLAALGGVFLLLLIIREFKRDMDMRRLRRFLSLQ